MVFEHTREHWLERAVEVLRPAFERAGYPLPERVRVSVDGSRAKRRGHCWERAASEDGVNQVFLSARLVEPVDVLQVLTHELCHAVDDCQSGHRQPFQRIAASVGLEGPPWKSSSWTDAGRSNARKVAEALGPYPHAKLTVEPKTQGTRNLKVACAECGYTARTTRRWLEEAGAPLCPQHLAPMVLCSEGPVPVAAPLSRRAWLERVAAADPWLVFWTVQEADPEAFDELLDEVLVELGSSQISLRLTLAQGRSQDEAEEATA